MSDNKRIAKNTLFLYVRMALILFVNLYTSRVILDKLGVEDFGLYNVVGGIIGMLTFVSGTLSIGTSRFITYELGTNNFRKLKDTFSTAFYTHVGIGIIMVVVLETVGLWFLYNKLIIPSTRMFAAVLVYHMSIFTMLISLTQIPYTALIMAHERMSIYAYISIFESLSKLVVVFAIAYTTYDKLIVYAFLITLVQLVVAFSYRMYCTYKYEESKLSLIFNMQVFKQMMKFSSWNIIANITEVMKYQGIIVLMNMFFAPAIVSAQAIANQIAAGVIQFVSGLRKAIEPQIIKLYASKDYEASMRLTLSSVIYCFDLVLMLALPLIFIMETVLKIWLINVPDYAVVFSQWILIQRIIALIDCCLYAPMMASGKVKNNAVACVFLGISQFAVLYAILKFGGGVMWIQYMSILIISSFSFLVKPYLLYRELNYPIKELLICYLRCFAVVLLSLIVPIISCFFYWSGLTGTILFVALVEFGIISAAFVCMEKSDKNKLLSYLSIKRNLIWK